MLKVDNIISLWRVVLILLDDESPTSANLGNDHEFIIEEYTLHRYGAFWGSPKQSHESLCSKWTISYHCGELCSSNMVSESCPKLSRANRLVNFQISNKELQKKKSRALVKGRRTLFEGRCWMKVPHRLI